jgi:hypothetical protein
MKKSNNLKVISHHFFRYIQDKNEPIEVTTSIFTYFNSTRLVLNYDSH